MTAALHTPGPWETWSNRGYGHLNGVQIREVRSSLVLAVAIGDVPELDAKANARLIAAAPDLLEAARPFEEIIQEGTDDLPDETGVTVKIGERVLDLTLSLADFRAIRAAIAKAVTP